MLELVARQVRKLVEAHGPGRIAVLIVIIDDLQIVVEDGAAKGVLRWTGVALVVLGRPVGKGGSKKSKADRSDHYDIVLRAAFR